MPSGKQTRLNYLSAQCPFGTDAVVTIDNVKKLTSQLPFGSVPFRHGVLIDVPFFVSADVSQLPFGSVPFRHELHDAIKVIAKVVVSITFRLSALSAPFPLKNDPWQLSGVSQLPFGSVPFRHS